MPHLSGYSLPTQAAVVLAFVLLALVVLKEMENHVLFVVSENFASHENKKLQRTLNSYKVYCPHKEKGCEWVGELQQCDDHLNKNASKNHAADLQADDSRNGCPFQEIRCNCCQIQFECRVMKGHLSNQCPYRDVECKYHIVGCRIKKLQIEIEKHIQEATETHLSLVAEAFSRKDKDINDLKQGMGKLKEQQKEQLTEAKKQQEEVLYEL